MTGESPVILIVDDDPQVRQTLQAFLEDEDLLVETAADGLEALERAAERRPALVVLDHSLPDLAGSAVADALRAAHGGHLPILLITADGQAIAKARQVGAFAYLRKPFELTDLVAYVRQGLSTH